MSLRVLIVDDHGSFRRLARRMFETAGFEVVGEAVDGQSALASVEALRPDLVLLDVMLPDISGLEVARMLPETQPVLLVSSRSADDLGVSSMLGGRRRFLRKDELSLERLREVGAGGW